MLASITDSVILLDLDYRVTNINTMFLELTGKSRAEVIGMPLASLLHESDILNISGVDSFILDNSGSNANIAFSTNNGEEDITLSVASAAVNDHAGTPLALFSVLTTIGNTSVSLVLSLSSGRSPRAR